MLEYGDLPFLGNQYGKSPERAEVRIPLLTLAFSNDSRISASHLQIGTSCTSGKLLVSSRECIRYSGCAPLYVPVVLQAVLNREFAHAEVSCRILNAGFGIITVQVRYQ